MSNEMSPREFLQKVKRKSKLLKSRQEPQCDFDDETHTTMSAEDVVRLQLDDLLQGSTSVAYKMASPSNRKHTAYDWI